MRMLALLFTSTLLGAQPLPRSAQGGEQPERGPVPLRPPDKLKPPKGNELLLKVEADGVQIYVSKRTADGKLVWSLKGPLADLRQGPKRAGYHYAGPSWEAADGSKVIRDQAEDVVSVPAPNAKADIPWLRIRVKPEGKSGGTFGQVRYVLRVETQGGIPRQHAPIRAGTEVGIRYKADYYFFGPRR
jgi:hypothetical protein